MDIETLYESGYLPTRYYNQLNKKSKEENYKRMKIGKNKKNESFLLSLIENTLSATMKTALDEILKTLKF